MKVCFEGGESVVAVRRSSFTYIVPQIYNPDKVGTLECASLKLRPVLHLQFLLAIFSAIFFF